MLMLSRKIKNGDSAVLIISWQEFMDGDRTPYSVSENVIPTYDEECLE